MPKQPEANPILQIVHDISASHVREAYPEEWAYFEQVWRPISILIGRWRDTPPKDWPLGRLPGSLSELSFGDATVPLNFKSIQVMLATAASIIHMWSLDKMPPIEGMTQVVNSYCQKVKLPEDQNKLIRAIADVHNLDRIALATKMFEGIKEYQLIINGVEDWKDFRSIQTLRNKNEKCLSDTGTPLHPLWIDDPRLQVYYKNATKRELEERPRRLLICLARRCTELRTYKEIDDEVWSGIGTNEANIRKSASKIREAIPELKQDIETNYAQGIRINTHVDHSIILTTRNVCWP